MEQSYNPNSALGGPGVGSPMPKNWLVESILVTLFCCIPFGVVGIINAASVNSKYASGDYAGAQQASASAGKWTKIGFFTGLALGVLYIVAMFLGFGGALLTGLMQNTH